uniref:Uncharacterized protein n=1 Tax=Candidatus Kentrum sp. FM TaxID=2126340 RepID=A0A450X3J8_9GAMM|nr:MAG: hypothetical protein BECKFM1743B_GA0114221_109543 [Candidatus Kentron sp. FM]
MLVSPPGRSASIIWKSAIDWRPVMSIDAVRARRSPASYRHHQPTTENPFVLLSVDFLLFLYAFHAAISIRYWFAIDIAIRYRYRSYPACSIASSDIDSERTTTPVAARPRYTTIRPFLVFCARFYSLSSLCVCAPLRLILLSQTPHKELITAEAHRRREKRKIP